MKFSKEHLMKKILILAFLFLISVVGALEPIKLISTPDLEYHPQFRPNTNDSVFSYTRYDQIRSNIHLASINNPDNNIMLDIDVNGDFAFCWSPDGTKLVFDSRDDFQGNLWIYDFSDSTYFQVTNYTNVGAFQPSWSPDGTKICFMYRMDLKILDIETGSIAVLLDDSYDNWHPSWSPDGSTIAFTSNRSGNIDIWMINSDGSLPLRRFTTSNAYDDRPQWSPDGRYIAYESESTGDPETWIKSVEGNDMRQITDCPGYDSHAFWSYDGTKLAFTSERAGTMDVFYADISEYLSVNEVNTPEHFFELKNYPNPFNPDTKIYMNIDKNSYCNLDIYNIRNEKVKSIYDGHLSKGNHEFVWQGKDEFGKDVASGTYIISLKSPDTSINKKCVLLK